MFRQFDSLVQEKDFFAAHDFYDRYQESFDATGRLEAKAVLHHYFNAPAVSNREIDSLLKDGDGMLEDSVQFKLLVMKQINHGKCWEYGAALETMDRILTSFRPQIKAAELEDFENTRVIWHALAGQPAQEVAAHETVSLEVMRDKAGLANLSVKTDNDSADFVFDTGANFCTATQTMARRFGMELLEGEIDVRAITGTMVKSRIARCPQLNLGSVQVRNAIFLVFPDSALAIPQIQYQIHGIIGFPVIEALREVQITQDRQIIIPKAAAATTQGQRMALDFLTPIIELGGDSYTFDTGANATILYKAYWGKYRPAGDSIYIARDMAVGGAGGQMSKKGYWVNFSPEVQGGARVSLDSVSLLFDEPSPSGSRIFGNVGQDLIGEFDRMTINFEAMRIVFDGRRIVKP